MPQRYAGYVGQEVRLAVSRKEEPNVEQTYGSRPGAQPSEMRS
jgi:hypothetical protein